MTTTPKLRDTHAIRAVTIPDAAFDNKAVERILHVMQVGTAALADDVRTFRAEAKRLQSADDSLAATHAVAGVLDMAHLFEGYVEESERIQRVLEVLNDVAVLAFVDFEGQTGSLIAELQGLLEEDGRIF